MPSKEDTTVALSSGATLVAPKGWSVRTSAASVELSDPDRASTVTFIERRESDPLAAIAAAWKVGRPGLALSAHDPDMPPPAGGWDAIASIDYDAPEGRAASALARRWGETTWVALVEGDASAVERRGAQIETALGSLRPRGMKEESFAREPVRAVDAAAAARLDAFAADALARLEVPGAAVAVLQGGKLAYERAFGVRELGKSDPVTRRTLFLVGSVTKPMTTLMEAALVDSKLLRWDTPVTQLLPAFALGDATLTKRLALWHMSCACTGMPRRDFEYLFEYADVTPEARLASMRTMQPTTGLGETFQYSNLLVAAGGFAAAHAYAPERSLGDAYATAMREKVFGPIGMMSTTLDFAVVARSEHASPHALAIDGSARTLPLAIETNVLPIAPAGAAWADLADFERYAHTELTGGVSPAGRRIVSEANVTERRTARVRSSADEGYGLGMDVSTFGGLRAFGHEGGAFGYGATMFLLPDADVAILVLTNVRNGGGYEQLPFNRAFVRKVVEELFASAKDVAAPSVRYYVEARKRNAAHAMKGVERAPDAAWLTRLQGTYRNPSLGKVVVAGTTFDAGEWKTTFGRLTHGGSTKIVFLDPPFAGNSMTIEGDPATIVADDGQARYVFTR